MQLVFQHGSSDGKIGAIYVADEYGKPQQDENSPERAGQWFCMRLFGGHIEWAILSLCNCELQ
jgi:hypothetical protein